MNKQFIYLFIIKQVLLLELRIVEQPKLYERDDSANCIFTEFEKWMKFVTCSLPRKDSRELQQEDRSASFPVFSRRLNFRLLLNRWLSLCHWMSVDRRSVPFVSEIHRRCTLMYGRWTKFTIPLTRHWEIWSQSYKLHFVFIRAKYKLLD